jgi:hypothetical protein
MDNEHIAIFVLLSIIIVLLLMKGNERMDGLPPYLTSGASMRHAQEFSASDQGSDNRGNYIAGPTTLEDTGIVNADLGGYVGSPMGTDMYNSGATLRDVGPVFTSTDQGASYQYNDPTYNSKYLMQALKGK